MNPQENPLEALIRGLGFTRCCTWQTLITEATVKVGWDNKPADYPFGPVTWLVCRSCGHRLRSRDIPPGRVVETEEEAVAVLRDA
jgi:hypothetical protein